MRIRGEQMGCLKAVSEEDFMSRLTAFVSVCRAPEKTATATRESCKNLMQRAQVYGLSTEFEVATFVACGVAFGNDFDTRDNLVFCDILQEPDVSARLKAAQMLRVLKASANRE